MKDIQAFPGKQKALMIKSEHLDIASEYEIEQNGMTLRDYFAAKAMQGSIAGTPHNVDIEPTELATWCYIMADRMLKARGE